MTSSTAAKAIAVSAVLVLSAGTGMAAFGATPAQTFSACLKNGTLSAVTTGTAALKCQSGFTFVTWTSAGDTSVTPGTPGDSAYQVAVKAGFKGDVNAWLASLVGKQGPAGVQGIKGDSGLPGIQGDPGLPGIQGEQGDPGLPGMQGVPGDPGLPGMQGVPGLKGDPGATGVLGSFDALAGMACTRNSLAGTIQVTFSSTGIATLKCATDENQKPYAYIAQFTTGGGTSPLSITAMGDAADLDGTIVSRVWDFGDGSPAGDGSQVSHTYSTPGTYTLTFTVTDNRGATAYGTHTFTLVG